MRREDLKFGLDSLVDVAFIYMNRPGIGKNCERSHRRKDGRLKIKHSKVSANETVVSIVNNNHEDVRAYRCPKCSFYHVGRGHDSRTSFYHYLKEGGGIDDIIDVISGIRILFR